jgi:hypothetical protein
MAKIDRWFFFVQQNDVPHQSAHDLRSSKPCTRANGYAHQPCNPLAARQLSAPARTIVSQRSRLVHLRGTVSGVENTGCSSRLHHPLSLSSLFFVIDFLSFPFPLCRPSCKLVCIDARPRITGIYLPIPA